MRTTYIATGWAGIQWGCFGHLLWVQCGSTAVVSVKRHRKVG